MTARVDIGEILHFSILTSHQQSVCLFVCDAFLISACDYASVYLLFVLASSAKMGLVETRLAIIPGAGQCVCFVLGQTTCFQK